jgi:hypothetical protein
VLVVLREVVGHAGAAGVDIGAAQFFRCDFFARGGLDEGRTAEEDRALTLDNDYLVAHGRHVGPASRAASHHGGDLGDAFGAHPGLVVEDAAEVFAVGEDLVLQRQERAPRIDEVDARQMVLLRYLLRPQVLLDRHRVVGAAPHGRVVGDHHHLAPRDTSYPRDNPCGGDPSVVHSEGRQGRELKERSARVQ